MLFLQPLFSAHVIRSMQRAGYADDGKVSARSKTLERNSEILALELANAAEWCASNMIPLDHSKCCLMHFKRSTKAA
jgi:hypothetical protein